MKDSATQQLVGRLPGIVAKLVTQGHLLELIDGDAWNIPTHWIKAVFNEMKEILVDKKLFVISILGTQSSGKSTLMNTMFGLQFPVSAGRCTRGALMQLVPMGIEDNVPFDYIVVVDTEGLRAPEITCSNLARDNELATLTVGLGDVTIINIKGENFSEMKDVLQIVVHAFIRMKMVNGRMISNPCMCFHPPECPSSQCKGEDDVRIT